MASFLSYVVLSPGNARSLLPKMDELAATVDACSPDLICIVETWLSPDISNPEISLAGYQLCRLDRDRHGGGVLKIFLIFSYFLHLLADWNFLH